MPLYAHPVQAGGEFIAKPLICRKVGSWSGHRRCALSLLHFLRLSANPSHIQYRCIRRWVSARLLLAVGGAFRSARCGGLLGALRLLRFAPCTYNAQTITKCHTLKKFFEKFLYGSKWFIFALWQKITALKGGCLVVVYLVVVSAFFKRLKNVVLLLSVVIPILEKA